MAHGDLQRVCRQDHSCMRRRNIWGKKHKK